MRVLLVEDEQSVAKAVGDLFPQDSEIEIASCLKEIPKAGHYDLALVDLKLGSEDGFDAVKGIRQKKLADEIVIVTAFGNVENIVAAKSLGVTEFLIKPVERAEIESLISRIEQRVPSKKIAALLKNPGHAFFVGQSKQFQETFKKAAIACQSDSPVLVTGESGAGKEMLARFIHSNSSFKNGPFESINCAALPENLIESELFGYEKGAFTGADAPSAGKIELANHGCLFLDEVVEMNVGCQAKLLEVTERSEFFRLGGRSKIAVKFKLICATNGDVDKLVETGKFRRDLLFRISVVRIQIPPLRERKDDIPLLTAWFLSRGLAEGITDAALNRLTAYSWPGNVRQLKNALEYAGNSCNHRLITSKDLPEFVDSSSAERNFGKIVHETVDEHPGSAYSAAVEMLEKEILSYVSMKFGGNQVKMSAYLGISRVTLRNKLRDYGLQ